MHKKRIKCNKGSLDQLALSSTLDTYLEPCKRYKMKPFVKIVNGTNPLFPQKLHLRCFAGFGIRP